MEKLDEIQAKFATKVLGVPEETPKELVYAELGWPPVKTLIMKAKILLAGRIFRANANQDPNTALLAPIRTKQVENGDDNGLLYEVFKFIGADRDPQSNPLWYHVAKKTTKNAYKTKCKKFLADKDNKILSQRLDANDRQTKFFRLVNPKAQNAKYVNATTATRSRIAQSRLSMTNAASKYACRLCKALKKETIQHLLCECDATKVYRKTLFPKSQRDATTAKIWKNIFDAPIKTLDKYLELVDATFYMKTQNPLFAPAIRKDLDPVFSQELMFARQCVIDTMPK